MRLLPESPTSKFKTLNSNLNILILTSYLTAVGSPRSAVTRPTHGSAPTAVIGRLSSVIGLFLLLLASCRCPDPILVDLGSIPDSILARVPYQSGMTYSFKHSGGQVIDFTASRDSKYEQTWCEEWCCDYVYKYQVNTTTLHPDYPVFDLNLQVSNQNIEYPSIFAWFGHSSFYLPLNPDQFHEAGFSDSLLMGGRWFYRVFSTKMMEGGFPMGSIYADSLYYNLTEGIIRIIMSNGEFYAVSN
jgi:hypothetical protein